MKYLKYILGIILLLGLLFIGKGFLTPSVTYDGEVLVEKSAKEAWAVMNDESKTSQWLKGIKNMEHISGEKGTVGAVTKYTFVEDGQESVILETIKSISPEKNISMDFLMEDVMTIDYKIDFLDQDGKTLIKSTSTTTGIGMLMRSVVSFMKGAMKAQEDENLNNLKKLIDGNTTDYFPKPVLEMAEEVME